MILRWQIPFTFARALWHAFLFWVNGKPVIAPAAVIAHRESKCRPCRFNDHGQCRRCACIISVKVSLSSERCPDAPPRWGSL